MLIAAQCSFIVINDKQHQQGNPFAAKSNVFARANAAADANRAVSVTSSVDAGFAVDDAPLLGAALQHATKTLENGETLYAYAVREFGDKKRCKILRFVSYKTGHEDHFKNTFTLCLLSRRTLEVQKTWLFYPRRIRSMFTGTEIDGDSDDEDDDDRDAVPNVDVPEHEFPARRDVELVLAHSITALTAGQRCADWFMFRLFLVSGTTAQRLARNDATCRAYLYQDPSLALDTVQSPEEMGKTLAEGWLSNTKNTGTTKSVAMLVGTRNEDSISAELRKKDFCLELYDVGLVLSKEYQYLGASADNVAVVVKPGAVVADNERVTVPVEIKTKVSIELVAKAFEVARCCGTYFACEVGGDNWWRGVPREYRGQLIQQACVFGSDYVLFCVGSVKQVIYSTLVNVPETVRRRWGQMVNDLVAPFVTWAWDGLDRGEPHATAPSHFSVEHRELLESRYPLWAAMHQKRVDVGGTLPPVRVIRALVQRLYSRAKPGVDGVDADGAWFATRQLQLSWGQKLVVSKMIGGMTNACTLWRVWKTYKRFALLPWPGLDRFRDQCSRETVQTSFAHAVSRQLISNANTTPGAAEDVEPSREGATTPTKLVMDVVERGRTVLGKRNRRNKMNKSEVRAMRETTAIHHNQVAIKSDCLVCHTSCAVGCSVCGAALHVRKCSARPNQRKTCWELWHSTSRLGVEAGGSDESGDV